MFIPYHKITPIALIMKQKERKIGKNFNFVWRIIFPINTIRETIQSKLDDSLRRSYAMQIIIKQILSTQRERKGW